MAADAASAVVATVSTGAATTTLAVMPNVRSAVTRLPTLVASAEMLANSMLELPTPLTVKATAIESLLSTSVTLVTFTASEEIVNVAASAAEKLLRFTANVEAVKALASVAVELTVKGMFVGWGAGDGDGDGDGRGDGDGDGADVGGDSTGEGFRAGIGGDGRDGDGGGGSAGSG